MLGRKGGFYAVVTNGLYKELKRLADVHLGKVDITVLMEPKCMTIEEKAEMEKYHARRTAGVCSTSSSADSMAKMKEEREREEREYRLRKKNTFTAACRRDVDKYEKLDLRVGYNF
jgi:hypothetical protein